MASAYPGGLDSFATNKTNATTTPTDHPTHHNDLADAINQIEAALGILPAALQTWTPTYGNLTVGNGTVVAQWAQIGRLVAVFFTLTFGSTTAISGNVTLTPPVTPATSTANSARGLAIMNDDDGGATGRKIGFARVTTTVIVPHAIDTSGAYAASVNLSSTVPFTWATDDVLMVQALYRSST